MPEFPIPKESGAKTLNEYFEVLSHKGLREKIKNVTSVEIDRLNLEIKVIEDMNFAGYFLIVADFVNHAKRNGIYVGPGRGSAVGSLVCYALGICKTPDYNLLERF
jgi:DNA polymerase-3 subunit alpha